MLGALPPALVKLGEEVAVLMPRYRDAKISAADRIADNLRIAFGPYVFTFGVDQVIDKGVRYLFVVCPASYDLPGHLLGIRTIKFAAAAFDHAALAVGRYVFRANIFHLHDWQTGLLPVYLRENFRGDPNYLGSKCLLTIHNIGYQGRFRGRSSSEPGARAIDVSAGGAGVLRRDEFPEGGNRMVGCGDDSESDVCERDSDSGVRVWVRWVAAVARASKLTGF